MDGFRDGCTVGYAPAWRNQNSENTAVLMVGDEKIRRLVESPVRSMSMDELLRKSADTLHEQARISSLILFVNSRSE